MSVTVLYFASLRDAAGRDSEMLETPVSLPDLYASLKAMHGFSLAFDRLRVAIDGVFVASDSVVVDGAVIAFIPPVSGG